MKVYLSGPMTGKPEHNYPAFNINAAALREMGYEVVNPAEIGPGPLAPREENLRVDIKALCDCDAIALLPGWPSSKGALLELSVAHGIGLRTYLVEELLP